MPAVKGTGSCMTAVICAYRGLIQLKGVSKRVHESQVEVPSKQLVQVRCCNSIWPAHISNESDRCIAPGTHWGSLSSLNWSKVQITHSGLMQCCPLKSAVMCYDLPHHRAYMTLSAVEGQGQCKQ